MRILTLEQRSDDWLIWRNTGLGSSDAAKIVGLCPPSWGTADSLLQQKASALLGQQEISKRENGAMARGRRLEPVAIELYESLMGFAVPATCGMHDELDWLKVSLDGYNKERELFVEVKAPNKDDHALALSGGIPEKYIPQLVHQYLVSGAKLAHYISYSDYFPAARKLAIVPYQRDEELVRMLFAAEKAFWDKVIELVEQIEKQTKKKRGRKPCPTYESRS